MAFRGEVALITGAASGMGRLAAQRLAAEGARVAAFDIDEEGLRQTGSGFDSIRLWPVDVSNPQAVDSAVREVESQHGSIDRVFNAAAIMPTGLMLEQDIQTQQRIMEINYGGTLNVTRATLPAMLERGRGELVNFASLAGWIPTPYMGAYNASKFAVVAMSEVLYHENRSSPVRIACVCPPVVDTPLLEQAESGPHFLAGARRIQPETVLDAIERALERGQFWVFPGLGTKTAWRFRRFLPGLVWRNFHKTEGL